MSYQVLARKWRPQNFEQMVGQQHVLRALVNALKEQRLHHAYLFTGTRGVGKTTIARILVKCLNCETGITAKPCGECGSCKEITEGRFVDLIEVDAASRTKVEDTRELLDNVHYAPTHGRFKVYLIDEVHMLSGHSFNALLKTLEEPPAHVKFLFATTDPQKLPATILSRCLQFNLKRMPLDLIQEHLQYLLQQESIAFEAAALKPLARAADGSMRDALSLMDQAIAFGAGSLKEQDVKIMLGTISQDWLCILLNAVADGDGRQLLDTVEDMAGQVADFEAAADSLISLLHQVALLQAVPDCVPDDEQARQLASRLSMEDVQLYYQIALTGRNDIPLSPDPRSGFEMLLLRMMVFRPVEDLNIVSDAPANDVAKKKLHQPQQQSKIAQETQAQDIAVPEPMISGSHVLSEWVDDNEEWDWHQIVPQLQLDGMSGQFANHCVLDKIENGTIFLLFDKGAEQLYNDAVEQELKTRLEVFWGKTIKISLKAAQISSETPAYRAERQREEEQMGIEQMMLADPFVKALQSKLGAQVLPGSIKHRKSKKS